jgi:DNA-binding CsgD family transcriptional regulator
MRLTWPLTGRAEEMRLIDTAISDPAVAGMVICGAAGVGKSRIAHEALDAVASGGGEVRWVVGTSSARGLPLGALVSWAGMADSDGLHLVSHVIESLTAATRDKTVVVGVDDSHLLDDLSLFVLHQIVQRRAAKLVLTIREDEPIPIGIQELWKAGQFDRLDLQPLRADQTTALLAATLAGPLDPDAASHLWRLTRGNVLYLRHIVEQETADGRLAMRWGSWQWTGDPTMPHGLVELIESRIGALPPAVGTVIDALAVGEPIELAALRRIVDPEAVEEADVRGLISLENSDSGLAVRLAHPLYGEVRRNRAAPTRLRRLRGLIAAELATAINRDDVRVVVRRATLSLDSDLAPDAELFVAAAHGAVCLADLPLADRLAAAAVRAGAGPEAMFARAHALSWLGRGPEAEEVLADVPIAELTEEQHARFTFLRASNVLWALADPAQAKAIIDGTSPHIASGPARSCLDAARTVYWFAIDRPDVATETSTSLVLDDLPPVVGAETSWVLVAMHADEGRAAEAVAIADAGYAISTRCSDAPHMRFNIADAHIGALLLAGSIDAALEVAVRERGHAADLPGAAHVLGGAIAGRAALGAGRLDTACPLLQQAIAAFSTSGHDIGWGYRYRIPLTTALAMRGLTHDAVETLAALDELQRPYRSLGYERSLARAWVAGGQGAISEAIGILRSAAEMAAANRSFAAEVMCLQAAVQFGDRTCAPRLGELEAIVEGPRVGLAARFATALAEDDAAELSLVSEGFEEMGDVVAAVDAVAHATMAYRRKDLRGSALGCAAQAEAMAQRCGGADTPTLRQAREPLPLTDREREIVLLVGQGMPNRDIAERLFLSIRTVEGHIYKAMSKTGTATREELAALVRHPGPPERP